MAAFITKERICLNADRSKVVPCDSPEAAWQLAGAGTMVDTDTARKYGLSAPEAKAVSKADVEDKAVTPSENKAVTPSIPRKAK